LDKRPQTTAVSNHDRSTAFVGTRYTGNQL
jgi:hypothetical protein